MKKLVLSLNEELEKTLNEEDKEIIQEQIEELNKKIEEKEYSRSGLIEELAKLNPGVEIRYQKAHDEVIYCSKNGSDLKLPERFEYNDKNGITNKHHTSSGRYTYVHVRGMENVPSDTIVAGKSEKKEKTEEKKDTKKGSLKEVVSCLFGQVDKRVNNLTVDLANEWRLTRYENPTKYVANPLRLITLFVAVGGIVTGGIALWPGLIAAGYFGGIVIPKYIAAVVRKMRKTPPKKLEKVELSKGSYLENLKNAVSKFKNRKTVKKQVSSTSSKTISKKDETVTTKSTINEKNKNIDNLLINFNNAVNSVDLNDIDMTKVDNCNSCYELLKNHGEVALNKISNETKEKYQKIQEYLKLIKEFSKAINVLRSDDINKDLLDNCKSLYDLLKNNYGENAFKNIPESILNKYNTLKDIKVEKELETVRKDKELAFSKFVSELKTFKLEQTVDGIKEYEDLMHRLFALDKEQRNMICSNEMLWNKIQYLRKEVKALQTNNKLMNNNTKLESFINHVETFKFGENVEFKSENLVAAISLYNQLTSDQKKMIPEKIMRNYQDAIRYDSITALKAKLYALDIDKCIAERDFDSIEECYKLYNKWYQNTSEGLKTKDARQLEKRKIDGQKQIEGLSRELSEKLQGIIKTITTKEQFANADVNVEYQLGIINGKARPISHVEVINNNEMIAVCDIPWNSKNPDVFEIRETIMEKFPFINENHIYFEGIGKENYKAGKR